MSYNAAYFYENIITILKDHSVLNSLINSQIFSNIPANTQYPYIRLNIDSELDAGFNNTEQRYFATLQVFSDDSSPKKTLRIIDLIHNIFNHQEHILNCDYLQFSGKMQCFQDNNQIWQGRIAFEIH